MGVRIVDRLTYQGKDLQGERAVVVLWDEKHGVWAVKLGQTEEVVGARTEKLHKIRKVGFGELGVWFRLRKEDGNLIDLPKRIEAKLDLSTGEKLVRRSVAHNVEEL